MNERTSEPLSRTTAGSVQLFPQRREAQQPLIRIHQTDRICLSLNLAMNRRDPANQIRFRIGQSMKSTHLVAVSPLEISLPHCQNKLGKLGC